MGPLRLYGGTLHQSLPVSNSEDFNRREAYREGENAKRKRRSHLIGEGFGDHHVYVVASLG